MTDAAYYGTLAVKLILAAISLWLYWKFIVFASRKTAEAGERQRQLADLELLYVASCKYIAERENRKPTREFEARPFALDFPEDAENDILVAQLKKSIQMTQRPNDAA